MKWLSRLMRYFSIICPLKVPVFQDGVLWRARYVRADMPSFEVC